MDVMDGKDTCKFFTQCLQIIFLGAEIRKKRQEPSSFLSKKAEIKNVQKTLKNGYVA